MAKRLSVLLSDELYNQLIELKGADEVSSIMEHVRSAIRLYLWYREQINLGFKVCARKEDTDKVILKEITLS